LFALCCLLPPAAAMAVQQVGETVVQAGEVDDDLYVAGGRLDILAEVDGDVLASGGRINIDSEISGDLLAIGGEIRVHGRIDDDLRLVGGRLELNATVADDATAAGGEVLLAPGARVGGDVLLSGGRVVIAGRVAGGARAAAGEIEINGQIDGDVTLAGPSIRIGPTASIRGGLVYRSPYPAEIDSAARIEGQVTHIETPMPERREVAGLLTGIALFLWLSLAMTGVVLYLVFPGAALAAARSAAGESWKSLGLGLAMFAATPLVGTLLMTTGIGWLLGGVLMSSYGLLLLFGLLIGVLMLGDSLLRKLRSGRAPSRLANSLLFIVLLLVVMVVGLIPVIGWLLLLLLLLLGVGGATLQLHRARSGWPGI
jgi:cytoskeletal protein CcmA (bactofilin family)